MNVFDLNDLSLCITCLPNNTCNNIGYTCQGPDGSVYCTNNTQNDNNDENSDDNYDCKDYIQYEGPSCSIVPPNSTCDLSFLFSCGLSSPPPPPPSLPPTTKLLLNDYVVNIQNNIMHGDGNIIAGFIESIINNFRRRLHAVIHSGSDSNSVLHSASVVSGY